MPNILQYCNACLFLEDLAIGHAIAKSLHKAGCNVYAASKKDIDTSDLESVKKFASAHPKTELGAKHWWASIYGI